MNDPSGSTAEDLLFDLLDRLDVDEGIDLEFKACRDKVPSSLWPTLSAFANTRGGIVVLGVSEDDGVLAITGVTNAGRIQQQLTDQLRNPQKLSVEVCGPDDIQRHRVAGVEVIVLRVRSAALRERPVYTERNAYDGTFLRRNSGDYRASKSEVDRMMRAASPIPADAPVVPGTGLDDLDPEALSRYRQRYRVERPGSPFNGHDDLRFLRAIDGYRRDDETGREGLTVAGLLMFGSEEGIRRWRSRHLIDYRYEAPGSLARWDDRVVWEGCLFSAFEVVYPRLVRDLPVPFALDGPYRVQESPIHVAYREALVNLLVHADDVESDASLVRQTAQSVRFRNPGASRRRDLGPDADDRSDPRNPALVRMFRFIGLADEGGTGLPKIFRAFRDSEFRPPLIDPGGGDRYEFALRLERIDLLSPDDRTWLSGLGVQTADERFALIHARDVGTIDNQTLRSLTGMHAFDATRTLTRLRDLGFLEKEGDRRSARYRLSAVSLASVPLDVSVGTDVDSGGRGASSLTNHPSLHDSESRLQGTDTLSLPTNDLSLHGNGVSLQGTDTPRLQAHGTDEEWLTALSAPFRTQRRMTADVSEQLVRQLCQVRPLTRNEIARWIGRSTPHSRELVRTLVERGALVMTNPERPNDPNQRYRGVPPATGGTERS